MQKFKSNALLAHEQEVNQLQADGDRLLQRKHPGSPTITVRSTSVWYDFVETEFDWSWCVFQAHRDTVQADWQAFLNLCLAQEEHLNNIDTYKKVTSCDENETFPAHLELAVNDRLFTAVPAGRREALRIFGETRFNSGPKVHGEQE